MHLAGAVIKGTHLPPMTIRQTTLRSSNLASMAQLKDQAYYDKVRQLVSDWPDECPPSESPEQQQRLVETFGEVVSKLTYLQGILLEDES